MSREAPVLILEYDSTEIVPGGAGNAANNVASLGGDGARWCRWSAATSRAAGCSRCCRARVERAGLVRPGGYRTPVKTRILAGGIHSAKQQVVRIDRYTSEPVTRRASRGRRARAPRRAVKAPMPCSSPTTARGW